MAKRKCYAVIVQHFHQCDSGTIFQLVEYSPVVSLFGSLKGAKSFLNGLYLQYGQDSGLLSDFYVRDFKETSLSLIRDGQTIINYSIQLLELD